MSNFDTQRLDALLAALRAWSVKERRIKGLALVGSWSQLDREHAECDADIVLVVDEPGWFRTESRWMGEIDWTAAGLGPGHWTECDSGHVCARHLKFEDGAEIEVSFVPPAWAAADPVLPATRRLAGNGMRILHDPAGLLGRLVAAL